MRPTLDLPRQAAILAAISLTALATSPALAWTDPDIDPVTSSRNFEPEGRMSADGRRLVVSGAADCRPVEGDLAVSVSVLQASAVAAARGFSTPQPCIDDKDGFTVELTVGAERPAFTAGPVEACAFATTHAGDDLTDADQWCTFIQLVVDPAM